MRKISAFLGSPIAAALAFLLAAVMAYGLLIPWLGFYWDDWPLTWISQQLGPAGLVRYFSTNRPVWGLLYQLTTPLLGPVPWHWQVLALLLRWGTALSFFWLVKTAWPAQKQLAVWSAALFLLYPGFGQQWISVIYTHFFIILIFFLASLALSLLAVRSTGRRFWVFYLGSLLLGALNLFSMEYFFLLELLRPLLFWWVLAPQHPQSAARLKQTARLWLPFLLIFFGAIAFRTLAVGFHTYEPALVNDVNTQPGLAVGELIVTAIRDVFKAGFAAWLLAFRLPVVSQLGLRTTQIYAALVAAGTVLFAVFLWASRPASTEETAANRISLLQILLTAFLSLFLAGSPFWLTHLPIELSFSYDRFTLPFMIGSSLALAALFSLLPVPRPFKILLLAVLLGFSIGWHYQTANAFRRDWNNQKVFLWQIAWRIPGVQPGTTLLANDVLFNYDSDNSMTAPLNWLFSPQNHSGRMDVTFYYPNVRLKGSLPSLQPGVSFQWDYLAAVFYGSTSQVVAMVYDPPGCLRVIDPKLEVDNRMLPASLAPAVPLSSSAPILSGSGLSASRPPLSIYGAEPAHGWCYYFEKADLARQQGDWEQVTALAEQAFTSGDYPNDPMERLPFIEGYAHTGQWEKAAEQSSQAQKITPLMAPILCKLWDRIEKDTPSSPDRQFTLQNVRDALQCRVSGGN